MLKIHVSWMKNEDLNPLDSLFEINPSSHFEQETSQESEFVLNGEKPIWESQKVMAELGIGLDLELKYFHIISTGTESISHSLHNLTDNIYNIYATANNSNNNDSNNNNNNNDNNKNNKNKNNNKNIVNSRQKFLSVETLSDKNKNKKNKKKTGYLIKLF